MSLELQQLYDPVVLKMCVPRQVMRISFIVFKYAVYVLLAINIYFFLTQAILQQAIDSAAWIALVMVMEYETRSLDQDYIAFLLGNIFREDICSV